MTFSMTTINGFRMESLPTAVGHEGGGLRFAYTRRQPDRRTAQTARSCCSPYCWNW